VLQQVLGGVEVLVRCGEEQGVQAEGQGSGLSDIVA